MEKQKVETKWKHKTETESENWNQKWLIQQSLMQSYLHRLISSVLCHYSCILLHRGMNHMLCLYSCTVGFVITLLNVVD